MSEEYNPLQNFHSNNIYTKSTVVYKKFVIADNFGVSTTPDSISGKLLLPDATQLNLTLTRVTTGLYQLKWTVPSNPKLGKYVLTVTTVLGLKSQTEISMFIVE
jgi:hypothetical protein